MRSNSDQNNLNFHFDWSANPLSNSDDDMDDIPQMYQPPCAGAKKSARAAILTEWIRRSITSIEKESKAEREKQDDREIYSIEALLAREECAVIKDPREYQVTLYELAKANNTIAVLPTGSGKTLIAVLLLKHILDKEVEDRSTGKPERFAFFLVNNTTLVFQQFSVLDCNLDHKILRVCGADGANNWSKSQWDQHLQNTMVIVCTADILVDCLNHGFLQVSQINMLIFDEAHHAKGNHGYARIMNEHYKQERDASKRPRVFGMTASPVDAKVDINLAAQELECTLDSKIVTTPLSDQYQNMATEMILRYDHERKPFETNLHQQLRARFGQLSLFQYNFRISKGLSSSIGHWASDIFWKFVLAQEQTKKVEARVEEKLTGQPDGVEKLNQDLAVLKEATEFINSYDFGKPVLGSGSNLSPKVLKLYQILQENFKCPTTSRCIVFVEQRWVARLLTEIFKDSIFDCENLKVGCLTGFGKGNDKSHSLSFKQQVHTLLSFRKGDINCLFTTSVAEEGLDIPDCNLVIRFDLYRTMIGYVQSKGRARHKDSIFIDMIETGNNNHLETIRDARLQANIMLNWCSGKLGHHVLPTIDDDVDSESDHGTVILDPKTGARLSLNSCLAIINHFVAMLPSEEMIPNTQPLYVISPHVGKFKCEVILPSNSPVKRCFGSAQRSKALAKRFAAFEMCRLLYNKQFLNNHFLPIYARKLPEMRNALLALSTKQHDSYPMRLKPSVWMDIDTENYPSQLYLTVVDIDGDLDRQHQPLGILSRKPLPKFPQFPIFRADNGLANVVIRPIKEPLIVDEELLHKLTKLYHIILVDIFNKEYEENTLKMPYWIVPLQPAEDITEDPFFQIDLEAIELITRQDEYHWTPETPIDFFCDKFIIDKFNGGVRYFTIEVDPTKKPLDPVPEDAPQRKGVTNILDYSISLFKSSAMRAKGRWNLNQPVIKAYKMQLRRNLLSKAQSEDTKSNKVCWICLEPLKVSTMTTRFVTMLLAFPCIIHRLEDYMIALEACNVLSLTLDANLALESVTKDSDNSDEHEEDKINFREGMGPNYERLEFMGDTFLKMATSISLYVQNQCDDEYEFHVARMLMLCNKNLFERAKQLQLYEYVRSAEFSRRTWYPPGLTLLRGKGVGKIDESPSHQLGDKTVADVCESLIGAAFVQYHQQGNKWKAEHWDNAVRTVTQLVNSPNHQMQSWQDYVRAYNIPDYQMSQATAIQTDLATKVEKEHPYRFEYPRLLASAFRHPSLPSTWDRLPSYQRLEFLGDSLFDVACVSYLYYTYPNKDPQWLTEHKMPMVSNRFLGALCVKLGFYKHMRHNSPDIETKIRDWVNEIHRVEEEASDSCSYWENASSPPKCLPDIVEAYIGAIFIDSNFDFSVVYEFFNHHVLPFFNDLSIYDEFAKCQPVTLLHNTLSSRFGCRDFEIMTQNVPSEDPTAAKQKIVAVLMIHDKIVAWKLGDSSRYGKVRVSNAVNKAMEGLDPMSYRAQFGCTCPMAYEEDKE
jgi:endoribonuclease Dicer